MVGAGLTPMVLPPGRADRIVTAVLHNIDDWIVCVEEIERHAIPENRVRALALLRDMARAKAALKKLMRDG